MPLSNYRLVLSRVARRLVHYILVGITVAWLVIVGTAAAPQASPEADDITPSSYDLAQAKPFNQLETFPVRPLPTAPTLRPNGDWIGRLMLPTEADYDADPGDWAWLELWHSPTEHANLVGQRLKLTWQPGDMRDRYVAAVTRDVTFSDQAYRFLANGNVMPTRLNGRSQVGPLQSLAGVRPQDDVTVRLTEVTVELDGDRPVIQTALEPVQITGREYGLVQLLGSDETVDAPLPPDCPGEPPCPSEFFRVQFYDPATQGFTGPISTVRIPQQPRLGGDRFFSNLRDLADSPAGVAGWYIYGARDPEGVFTVQSLKPRALFQLDPDRVVLGRSAGLNYIDRGNWQDTPQRQGTLQRVLLAPAGDPAPQNQWQAGDYALLIHLFGGIGGEKAEFSPLGTVAGHFAYGLVRVVREPLTNELQFDIKYQQIYAQNPNGIASGTHDWIDYIGDMQRGWLGVRPVSDIVVKLDAFITPFQFGDTQISLFRELLLQTQIIAARYRVGDGTGVSAVTPAASCVQDSNQALFIAMQQIRRQIESHPEIVTWVQQHPDSPEAQRAKDFVALGEALEAMLVPYGVVRADWQTNAETLAAVESGGDFISSPRLTSGVLSWQTMMPRWGHDQVARIFLQHGAQLWFLRTNMVGGFDPGVEPIAPTTLMGGIPVVGRLVQRLADAFAVWPTGPTITITLGTLALYAALAIPVGLRNGFLRWQVVRQHPLLVLLGLLRIAIFPALAEEIVFRVLLLPHPVEGVPVGIWLLWGLLSLGLFMLYHWVIGKTVYRSAWVTLSDPRFIVLMGWLGIVLIGLYGITGSLWLVTFGHWAVVAVWIYILGGYARLAPQAPAPASP